jgi:hypothetical protein
MVREPNGVLTLAGTAGNDRIIINSPKAADFYPPSYSRWPRGLGAIPTVFRIKYCTLLC